MSEAKAKKKKLSIPVKLAIALVLGVVAGLILRRRPRMLPLSAHCLSAC